MEFIVTRVCESGRVLEKHIQSAGRIRGVVRIAQERDNSRHRTILVARVFPAEAAAHRSIPPLWDANLVGATGEVWVLVGYERIQAGPLAQEHSVGQSWLLEPAASQDLIDAETKWTNAVREANVLKDRLRALEQGDTVAPYTRAQPHT